jgi:hypothetical protein
VRATGEEHYSMKGSGSSSVKTSSSEVRAVFKENFIFIGALVDTENLVVFLNTHCYILDTKDHYQVMATGHRNSANGLYQFGGNF